MKKVKFDIYPTDFFDSENGRPPKLIKSKKMSKKRIEEIGKERCEQFEYNDVDEDVKKLIAHILYLENKK